jgi:hypothetical protein
MTARIPPRLGAGQESGAVVEGVFDVVAAGAVVGDRPVDPREHR